MTKEFIGMDHPDNSYLCYLCFERKPEIYQLFRQDTGRIIKASICGKCHSMITDKMIFCCYGVEYSKEFFPEWVVIEGTARWWIKQRHHKIGEVERYIEERMKMTASEWQRLWQNEWRF